MPPGIRTLGDLDLLEGRSAPEKPSGRVPEMKVKHIPHLDDADAALRLLTRIHSEFYPIVERRGYHVFSLSEMCCCGDGVDFHADGKRTSKRKLRKMGDNILGYNRTHSNGRHDIHLRLRDVRDHNRLLSYEEVAGTMSHELAHCEHGPHNAKFYKLMDEIQEQHATFMVRGIVADQQGFPMNSSQAYTLGGGGGTGGRNPALEAARQRQEKSKWMPQGPQKLGGDAGFRRLLAPGQAAGMAAEARRLRDEQWCQPCQDVVELDDSSDEDESLPATAQNELEDHKPAAAPTGSGNGRDTAGSRPASVVTVPETTKTDGADDRKPAAVTTDSAKRPASVVTIDLTVSDEEDSDTPSATEDTAAAVLVRGRHRRKQQRVEEQVSAALGAGSWPCTKCTFVNPPLALACGMCGTEANSEESTMKAVAAIRREDEIEQVKQAEVERSKEQFGFNIYGKERQPTSTLKHLT